MTPSVFSVILNVGDVSDDPPDFIDSSGNVYTINEKIQPTVEHSLMGANPLNQTSYPTWDSIRTQNPCTFSLASFTITQGVGRTDDPEGDYVELYDHNTGLLLTPTTLTDRVDVRFASQHFPDAEASDFITYVGGVYTIQQNSPLQFEAEITATNVYGTRTFTLKSNVTANTVADSIDVPSLITSTFDVADGTAAGTTVGTLASTASLTTPAVTNEIFSVMPQIGSSSDALPDFNSTVNFLNIDKTTGVITLSADADLATQAQMQFLVGTVEANYGLTKFTLVTVNVVPNSLQSTTMTTGTFNYYGAHYGFQTGYYHFGTMGGNSNVKFPIPQVYPNITNPLCEYLHHYNGKTNFYVRGGSQPDNDNTWTELVITGISHSGSATYNRANVVQKFVYGNFAVQYRWNEFGSPFGTTVGLSNDPNVTTNVEWK
jgi:hypothetical protein